jgi:tetratricopeptide (TPR) repeat protein
MKPVMSDKINISPERQKLIVYIFLAVITFAVFWQVQQYDFINFDDDFYVTQNSHIKSGLTPEEIRWAFSTKYFGLWNPLVWISFMFDYQLFGLHAGGYHLTNLILHILSALLLFWLFNRMTGAVWRSAFVAALFALHPLHVESVAWIAERKDVLSAFFWMLTLCLYVYYTEKPAVKRYLLVLFSFVCALLSKPMVATLPVIMIILDYWPLKRFELKKGNVILWQLKEKIPFFILSAALVIITLYNTNAIDMLDSPSLKQIPLISRLANAPVAFATYLGKTFWPQDMAVFYPFSEQLPLWQVWGASLLIILISAAVIIMVKRLPYLFVGWLWFSITIAPVIGIIQISIIAPYAMADRYHYLPSIGLAIMIAWGIPSLIKSEQIRKKILFPSGIAVLATLAVLTWQQCGYWKNGIELFSHALQITKNNAMVHNNRGITYEKLGQHQLAINDYNEAIILEPDYAIAYYNRGCAYDNLRQPQRAVKDYNEAIRLKPDYAKAYYNRGTIYGKYGKHQNAIFDFNQAISLKPNDADAYNNRGMVYLNQGNNELGCVDAQKACAMGICNALEMAKGKGLCR